MITNSVLIVDDVPENINVAVNFLLSERIDVSVAMSGAEALESVSVTKPDLILLDIMMPEMDGYETCKHLKNNPDTADIPIIFLTAKNERESMIQAFEAGAVDYITKPFNSAELIARVHAHLKIRNQQAQILEHERKLTGIYDNANEAIFVIQDGNIVFFNNRLASMFETEVELIKQTPFDHFVYFEDRELLKRLYAYSARAKQNPDNFVIIRGMTTSKRIIYLKVNALSQTWNGKSALLVLCDDITAQREAEERLFQINASLEELVKERTEKLKLSELNFINLFEKSNDSVIINDFEGNIVNANQVASDMLGYPREELLKMKTDQIVYRNAYGHVPLREKIKNNTNFIYQLENITAEGKRIPVEVRSTVVDYFGKKHIMSAGRDITDRVNAEKIRLETIISTEEQERKRFAKDLHDGLGASLSAAKMYLNIVKRAEHGSERALKMLDEAIALLDKAAKNAKEIAVNILPHDLAHFGLVASLTNFVERINEIGTVHVSFESGGYHGLLKINEEIQLFRTVNELINNTLKYAEAKNIHITLDQKKTKATLFYKDDGKGFDVEKVMKSNKSGIGLDNVIQRSRLMNGNAFIESTPGNGMTAKIFYHVDTDRLDAEL